MNYKQLTREQRYQIYALMKAGHSQRQMASIIGIHKTTISREMRRNRGRRGYRPRQAHTLAHRRLKRQRTVAATRITLQTWQLVESLLQQDWSPEQISGWLKREKKIAVSHERIYQHIYGDKAAGGDLYRHLRCHKKRRKRYGINSRRGQIPERRSIDERPPIVATRRRIGDWEADTIIGQNHQQAILSLTERKSKLCLLKKVERNTAEAVSTAMSHLLHPLMAQVHTITSDNGREFAHHLTIATQLEAGFYFAHPYSSWERGTNENTNGLVRQYFPKKSDFSKISEADIEFAMERLNKRPRKTLGYRTPHEVFFKDQSVALRC
jgi:transposase, IS30 family